MLVNVPKNQGITSNENFEKKKQKLQIIINIK